MKFLLQVYSRKQLIKIKRHIDKAVIKLSDSLKTKSDKNEKLLYQHVYQSIEILSFSSELKSCTSTINDFNKKLFMLDKINNILVSNLVLNKKEIAIVKKVNVCY